MNVLSKNKIVRKPLSWKRQVPRKWYDIYYTFLKIEGNNYNNYFTVFIRNLYPNISSKFAKLQDTENIDASMKDDGILDTDINEVDNTITNEDEGAKPIPAATMSSFSIEDVSVSVPQIDAVEIDGGNVSETIQ